MSLRRSEALCPLALCAGVTRRGWHRKNSRRIVPSNKRAHPPARARRHLADRLFRQGGRAAFCRVEMSSNCRRPRLRPELRWKYRRERAWQAELALALRLEQTKPGLRVRSRLRKFSEFAPM